MNAICYWGAEYKQEKASMFRYRAMALESDFDEFGYTDASDIEIESEILELGEEYEAPEPEFQRHLQTVFRDIPAPVAVPRSHPAVLPSNAPASSPKPSTGMVGAPSPTLKPASMPSTPASSAPVSPVPQDAAPKAVPAQTPPAEEVKVAEKAAEPKQPAPTRVAKKQSVKTSSSKEESAPTRKKNTPVKAASSQSGKATTSEGNQKTAAAPIAKKQDASLPRKAPAKEQIAPLAGKKSGATAKATGNQRRVPVRRP
jgi:hypothetical protein